jgi:muramoyltetrapeptide carboxypeptidase LdcA involved in peptidoglycan recycling
MKYPRLLKKGDTIGICAPSSGVGGEPLSKRLDNAILNIKALGYNVIETASVRSNDKCVSTDSVTRVSEFMNLYENPDVAAIIPPWGGEFGMDMLPCLDFEKLAVLPAKWVCGYSDTTTLMFPLTVISGIATVHGSNSMNMGYARIHATDLRAFDVMSRNETEQRSWNTWGDFANWDVPESSSDLTREAYTLDKPSVWKSLQSDSSATFSGRMIGGCLDVMSILAGTRFAPVETFIDKYKNDSFVWALESAEMSAANIYRAFWKMRECGWFRYCNGIIFGRPDGYKDTQDFTLTDALRQGLGSLNVPIIYDADIGHIPPQMQIVNGAMGVIEFADGQATVRQTLRSGE